MHGLLWVALVAMASPQDAQGDAAADPAAKPTADPAADPAKKAEPCQVAIMNLQPKGLPPEQEHVPELLTDSMAAEVASQTSCKVITQADIIQMLDFEATKAACSEESESCLAEIGGALGVERVIGGTVGMLGSSFKLQVKLQNVREGKVEKRIDRLIRGEPEVLDVAARNAGRELFGLPLLDEAAETPADATKTEGAADGSEASTEADAGDGGSALGAVVLTLGLVGVGAGLLVAALAGATAGFTEAALGVPAIPVPADTKLLLRPVGIVALVGVAAGVVVLGGGGVLTTIGLFVE